MQTIIHKDSFKFFFIKIILPTFLTICLFILTIFFILIPQYKENIMNGKREMIKELTNSAWSILCKYENDEKNGLLSRSEAQKTAISRIEYLRYGEENKDYFWITDLYPIMIMHPYRLDLNGTDLSNYSDPHGKKMFVEFVNTVKKLDHGYVNYMWQWKDDPLHIVPKLSYVKIFKPWGWVIGTGIYIEDVKKETNDLTQKLLWISICISSLIAFLLFFVSQQSLKIERKRIEAEKKLNESKEKYKTLVEAATEGLIMLIDGKISFSNSIISKITGYKDSELINFSLKDIISDNNNKIIIEAFSNDNLKEGQYEINLKKKNGEFVEVLIIISTAMFYNKSVNIIIVKDITANQSLNFSSLDYQKLINTLDLGFFRAKIDSKGKFIFANETAIKILGFENFRELSETYILELFANYEDKKTIKKNILDKGYLKNKIFKIKKKNNEIAIVKVTLIAFNNDKSEELICDGIIEDITLFEKEKIDFNNLIIQLKTNSFLIEQPVKSFISPFFKIDADLTIQDAIKKLELNKTDTLLLTKNEKDYIGIITNSDIQKRVLGLNLSLDNPIYLIMSSPIIYINENTLVNRAINIYENNNINHLVVINDLNEIIGILKKGVILDNFKNSLLFFQANINKAETIEELAQYHNTLISFIKPLVNSELSAKYITNITSSFSDSIFNRIIELVIKEIGEPPVSFSFICLGSEGRKEETLFTDQDNAIIYEDIAKENEALINDYFNNLGTKICTALNIVGYSFCKGNIMAMNPLWCKPISVWENYFINWVTTPEPQHLLDASIFFDFRHVYGNISLSNTLKNKIGLLINDRPLFLYHLAYNTYNTKLPQISSGNIISDKTNDLVDLKSAINILIMFTRTYALQCNIKETNTIDRLFALRTMQIIHTNTIDEILFAYNFLMKLRLKNQVVLSNNKMPLSNLIQTKNLLDIEVSILKKVLSLLPTYQNKIAIDFRVLK